MSRVESLSFALQPVFLVMFEFVKRREREMKALSMKERDLLACHVKEVLEEMHPSHYIVFFSTTDKKSERVYYKEYTACKKIRRHRIKDDRKKKKKTRRQKIDCAFHVIQQLKLTEKESSLGNRRMIYSTFFLNFVLSSIAFICSTEKSEYDSCLGIDSNCSHNHPSTSFHDVGS